MDVLQRINDHDWERFDLLIQGEDGTMESYLDVDTDVFRDLRLNDNTMELIEENDQRLVFRGTYFTLPEDDGIEYDEGSMNAEGSIRDDDLNVTLIIRRNG